MSLRISDFYTPDAQNFVFRNACFPILVDIAAQRVLKGYAHAPIISTLAGLVAGIGIAYASPLPLQILGGGIFLVYKASAYALSYWGTAPKPIASWDDVKVGAVLRSILPLIESQTDKENLYRIPGRHGFITTLASDPGAFTIEQIVKTDVYTQTGFVKGLLHKMNPPLMQETHQLFENAISLPENRRLEGFRAAFQALPTPRREIFQMLILHLHKISTTEGSPQSPAPVLASLFSTNFMGSHSPELTSAIACLIQNPAILE